MWIDRSGATLQPLRRVGMAGVALLGGCTQLPPLQPAPATLPVAASTTLAAAQPYRIAIGDELAIRLPLDPELSESVRVLPDGSISTSVVQRQVAAGLTLPQLDTALVQDYEQILKKPVISVIVIKSAPTTVYVLGYVEKPGVYSFEGSAPRLAQAIAAAGGLKLGANPDQIYILRHLPNGSQQFFGTKFADLQSARDPAANVPLAASDEVFVPRSAIARAYGYFNQYFQQFIATSASVNYQVNSNGTTSVIPGH
ncbi:polysaccharide export protein [Acidiphilium sp. PA]|uniref:polysaccharide biosynthesis/export family protein n=1 Tax=Acidiphilium sp. PA TaxID=2871705 RepID=UPI002244D976|nr:polysaccharide biosynthesis/export family protein [Acidiphilium sp. PA]MCW8308608.1 polysaccharide export protein [Acidiphilium sp. PA]